MTTETEELKTMLKQQQVFLVELFWKHATASRQHQWACGHWWQEAEDPTYTQALSSGAPDLLT